jgi:hypothetical protein
MSDSYKLWSKNTDWCVKCGREHGYISGPCSCGGTIFTRTPLETKDLIKCPCGVDVARVVGGSMVYCWNCGCML